MAAVSAKKPAAKKAAVAGPPEPVELTFTLEKETKGTYVFKEDEGEDGTTVVRTSYLQKWYFEQTGFVPDKNTVLTMTLQVDQLDPE